MKKLKATRDMGRMDRILAVISEGGNTTADLVEKGLGSKPQVAGVLQRLAAAGKIRQEKKGAPWRTDGPAVSPQREEDEPEVPAAARLGRNIRAMILDALRSGPLSRYDLVEQIRPHLNGRNEAGVDTAIAGLCRAHQIHRRDGMYRLGRGKSDPRPSHAGRTPRSQAGEHPLPSGKGRGHPVIGPLYDQWDRLGAAIVLLEEGP